MPRQTHRIDHGRREQLDVRQVARCERELLIRRLDDDQHILECQRFEMRGQQTRLRRLERERGGHDQAILAYQLGEHRANRAAIHFAVDLLRKIARLRGEGAAAADPDGTANRAGACRARALLAPRLLAAAAHLRSGLLRLGAGTPGRAVGVDHLEDERRVVLAAEVLVRDCKFRALGHFELHDHYFFGAAALGGALAGAFAATGDLLGATLFGVTTLRAACRAAFSEARTITLPPAAPGRAP